MLNWCLACWTSLVQGRGRGRGRSVDRAQSENLKNTEIVFLIIIVWKYYFHTCLWSLVQIELNKKRNVLTSLASHELELSCVDVMRSCTHRQPSLCCLVCVCGIFFFFANVVPGPLGLFLKNFLGILISSDIFDWSVGVSEVELLCVGVVGPGSRRLMRFCYQVCGYLSYFWTQSRFHLNSISPFFFEALSPH